MLFHPDSLSHVSPSSLEEVHALAERGLVAGLASGYGLGVLCIHVDGFEDWLQSVGREGAEASVIRVLENLPLGETQILCGHRVGAQTTFYVQGVDGAGMRALAEACSASKTAGRGRQVNAAGLSVGAAHSEGQQRGAASLESVRLAAVRGARLALRTGGGRFAFIERFGLPMPAEVHKPTSEPDIPQGSAPIWIPRVSASSFESLPPRSAGAPKELDSDLSLGAHVHGGSRNELERLLKSSELAWQNRVEILERRLEKMGRLLEGVGHNNGNAIALEAGVSSRFQTVQGLNAADTQFEAKSGLMSALFLANQKMREGLNGRSAG